MTGDAAHHLGRVLRAEAGQLYELSDGKVAWVARIERAGRDEVTFELEKPSAAFARASVAKLMLSERVGARPMREILPANGASQVTLAIGPEGGWTDEEFAAAASAGFHEAALGNLILRTETAVIAALAGLNYALG